MKGYIKSRINLDVLLWIPSKSVQTYVLLLSMQRICSTVPAHERWSTILSSEVGLPVKAIACGRLLSSWYRGVRQFKRWWAWYCVAKRGGFYPYDAFARDANTKRGHFKKLFLPPKPMLYGSLLLYAWETKVVQHAHSFYLHVHVTFLYVGFLWT